MGKIYKNQTTVTLIATLGQDITGASSLLIKYIKPDFTTGEFTATSTDDTNGVIQYAITADSDLDQSGNWVFWAYVIFSDTTVAAGEPYTRKIYEQGS